MFACIRQLTHSLDYEQTAVKTMHCFYFGPFLPSISFFISVFVIFPSSLSISCLELRFMFLYDVQTDSPYLIQFTWWRCIFRTELPSFYETLLNFVVLFLTMKNESFQIIHVQFIYLILIPQNGKRYLLDW